MHSCRPRASLRLLSLILLLPVFCCGCDTSIDLPDVSINFSLFGVFVTVLDPALDLADSESAAPEEDG